MRVTLIHNPGAGAQRKNDRERLTRLLRDAGHEVRYQSCKDEGWEKVLEAPTDLVAVAGGDGTVSRVAKRMVGRGVPLAPLPAGTANNIARTLGLVERPWEELVQGWREARRVKLDVGVAQGPWGERTFVEGVGAGLFACLLSNDDPERKLAQVKRGEDRVAHALKMLQDNAASCGPIAIRGTLDGRDISGAYLLIEALNILYVGPNLFLAPDSQPGDGHFDLVLVSEAERDRLTEYLARWQDNRERLAVLPSHRGKHLRIDWDGFELHIDDALWPEKEFEGKKSATLDFAIGATDVEFLAPDGKK